MGVTRAEMQRLCRTDFVRAAQALGASPFLVAGSATTLSSLDFQGFGMPPGTPSLGELVAQGRANRHAPWISITAFMSMTVLLLLVSLGGDEIRSR